LFIWVENVNHEDGNMTRHISVDHAINAKEKHDIQTKLKKQDEIFNHWQAVYVLKCETLKVDR